MDNIIVYLDDASYALQILQPMLPAGQAAVTGPTRWIMVGCAPRVTHHVSRFVTHSARDNWRRKWSDKVFGQIVPALHREGDVVLTLLAHTTLTAQTDALIKEHGAARVLDARRPKFGQDMQPVTTTPTQGGYGLARNVTTLAGMGLLLGID